MLRGSGNFVCALGAGHRVGEVSMAPKHHLCVDPGWHNTSATEFRFSKDVLVL